MATYAPVPAFAERKRHPRTLAFIIAGHAAVVAAVMAAKMEIVTPFIPSPTDVAWVPLPPEPPPPPPPAERTPEPATSTSDRPVAVIPTPVPRDTPSVDQTPVPIPNPGPIIGPAPRPSADPPPQPIVRTGPRFATPPSQLRPPYPASKIATDEEASLRLRLSIDERGRVTAVEPVGSADPIFLAAARRHLIARWRYEPATEGGRPVASSTVITLRFQLDD